MFKSYKSPAKINLCLHVLGRYANGYHALAMAMQRLDLCDIIDIHISEGDRVRVTCDSLQLAEGEQNIAAKAAMLLLSEANLQQQVTIDIKKNIPIAAGLGGGSSNAATVLSGLSEMLGLHWSAEKLQEIGVKLGADVPFFLFEGAAWATGVGSELKGLSQLPDFACLLVNPRIPISTAWAYSSLQLTKGGELANLPRFSAKSTGDLCAELHNDFEAVVIPRFPVIAEIKQQLLAEGAIGSLMSGSGATVFGIFPDFKSAQQAGERLIAAQDWFVHPARPL